MRQGSILVIVLFAIAAQPTESRAQTTDTSQIQAFTRSEFYKGLLSRAFASLPETVFKRCPTLVSNSSQITLLKSVTFGADGFPNAGQWKQVFPVSGCGNDTVLNFYFSAGADEKINTTIGNPGTTHADLTLQRDAFLYANTGASLLAKDCKTFVVKNTRFEGFGIPNSPVPDPGPDQHLRPWWETWTMAGCGRTIDVPIDFMPDAKGTRIVQPSGAKERQTPVETP
jgi:hypothetical protein